MGLAKIGVGVWFGTVVVEYTRQYGSRYKSSVVSTLVVVRVRA
jgi:hypothetical protein